jgi:hypothetical protein
MFEDVIRVPNMAHKKSGIQNIGNGIRGNYRVIYGV